MTVHAADVTSPKIASGSVACRDLDESDDASPARADRAIAAALLAAVAVLLGVDVLMDCLAGAEHEHVIFEGVIFAVAAGGLLYLARRIRRVRVLAGALRRDLAKARADATKWRQESQSLLTGLGAAIDRQFADWSLSAAEKEVGLLLLKGLSLKEIAEARGTSERTVRQQALAVYRKAGLAGRAELSAFFLEDLLLPQTPSATETPPPVAPSRAGRP